MNLKHGSYFVKTIFLSDVIRYTNSSIKTYKLASVISYISSLLSF